MTINLSENGKSKISDSVDNLLQGRWFLWRNGFI